MDRTEVRNKRRWLLLVAAASAVINAIFALPPASAQDFPNRTIKLVVPHAPGGNSDALGRILAQRLSERLGQPVVVENRPGAGGTIASAAIARAAPDGYTILVADNGTHAIAKPLFGSKLPYDVIKDFTPITLAAMFPVVLLVNPSVPAQTLGEFVALVKSRPGKFTFSSSGIPTPIVEKLNSEITAALKVPETRQRLGGLGLDVIASSPAQYSKTLAADIIIWGEAVKRSGATSD